MSPFPDGKQVARARNLSTAEVGIAILGASVESSHLSICELVQAPTMRLREYERSRVSILLMISFTSAFVSFVSNQKLFQDLLCQMEVPHTVFESSSIG